MKKYITNILLFAYVIYLGVLTGCGQSLYDKEQQYHDDYYELEHYINDALGSYLTIDRYQIPADYYIVFDVCLRSSYYTDADLLNDKPIWLVVDEFRCLCNEFLVNHPNYFGNSIELYSFIFYRDDGASMQEIAVLMNHLLRTDLRGPHYDILVVEDFKMEIVDSQLLRHREEIIATYLRYESDNPSVDECISYFCDQIESFPNLEYFRIEYTPFSIEDEEVIETRILNTYDYLTAIETNNA